MAGVIFTEDREVFERQLFRPPHAARMSEHAGRFTSRLDDADKTALLKDALDQFWEKRSQIQQTQDILRKWIEALEYAAARRPRWQCAISHFGRKVGVEWVRGVHLGKDLL